MHRRQMAAFPDLETFPELEGYERYADGPFGRSWPGPVQQPVDVNGPIEPESDFGICMATGGGALFEHEEDRGETIFPAPVLALVKRYCENTAEAVEMLIRYNGYWGPCNAVVGDADGNGALFEKSKYEYAVGTAKGVPLTSTHGGVDDERLRALCDTANPLFE